MNYVLTNTKSQDTELVVTLEADGPNNLLVMVNGNYAGFFSQDRVAGIRFYSSIISAAGATQEESLAFMRSITGQP